MSKCLLVGIEDNTYTNKNTGELVRSTLLHVVHDRPVRAESGLKGQRVESIKVQFDCSDLECGKKYELVWGSRRFGRNNYAQLEDLQLVQQ